MPIEKSLTELLRGLAEKYETEGFLTGDPSWFMHQVQNDVNQEVTAFVASALSYGNRKLFMPKIAQLLEWAGGDATRSDFRNADMSEWVRSGAFEACIPDDSVCFYRLYSNAIMRQFLRALQEMLQEYGSIKTFIATRFKCENRTKGSAIEAIEALTEWFREHGSTGVVPKDSKSSCKRLAMFLRWMVRKYSPVDLGLWADLIDRGALIVPMDTHVVQEANRLGLTRTKATSMSAALKLTDVMREIWPDDPLRGDFALFGLGINEND